MFKYKKHLEYPVDIKRKDLSMAKNLVAQYGGPDGELAAALRYLNQRYTMPDEKGKALLTDIGTEELAHVEMICAMISQLVKGATPDELAAVGLSGHYTQHDNAPFPTDANGVPFTSAYFQSTGEWKADLYEDMAAEQKARVTYAHLMKQTKDPDIIGPLNFLYQREVVHFNRFKQLLEFYEQKYPER